MNETMKKIFVSAFLFAAFWLNAVVALACPACEKQQPKILRGITHGAGPQSNWDYVIVWAAVAVVAFTLYFSVKWLFRPGETSREHIKRWILETE
jgi:hypothetical protein